MGAGDSPALRDCTQVMSYKQCRASLRTRNILHLAETFFLKVRVANRQHLVHQKNLGVEMRGHREGQTHMHTARIAFHRGIQKFLDLSKDNNLIEFPTNFCAAHPGNGAV